MTLIHRVSLAYATEALLSGCVAAATTEHPDAVVLGERMTERHLAASTGRAPSVIDLLLDHEGPAGWVGLAHHSPGTWESTTYLAPRLRGTGLLDRARCWQAHHAQAAADWERRDRPDARVTVISSIASWNQRSLAASRRYALQQGWPDTWRRAWEESKQRESHILTWPGSPVPHDCYLTEPLRAAA